MANEMSQEVKIPAAKPADQSSNLRLPTATHPPPPPPTNTHTKETNVTVLKQALALRRILKSVVIQGRHGVCVSSSLHLALVKTGNYFSFES